MSQIKKILKWLRPGIRGKLSLFIGIMLFVIVGLTLAIVLKQQYRTLSSLSQKEITRYLSPVDALTREIAHHMSSLARLERLKYTVQQKKNQKLKLNELPTITKNILARNKLKGQMSNYG